MGGGGGGRLKQLNSDIITLSVGGERKIKTIEGLYHYTVCGGGGEIKTIGGSRVAWGNPPPFEIQNALDLHNFFTYF